MASPQILPKLRLLSLPPETLDEIITNIPSPSSLLSLSKSSKTLAASILPHHLPFRVIRAPLSRADIWKHLARDGFHAANVRSLTILQDVHQVLSPDEYAVTERLPPVPEDTRETDAEADGKVSGSHTPSENEAGAALALALRNMVRLHLFAWYRLSSPVLGGEDDIWSVLRRLGTVRELDILDKPSRANDGSKQGIIFSDTFLRLTGFTTLKLHSSALDYLQDEPNLTLLINMLQHNCRDLESLSLSLQLFRHISTASLSPLLSHVSWSHLRVVRLTDGLGCSAASLARFLRAHPGIEELALGRMLPGRGWREFGEALHKDEGTSETMTDILPRLTNLECSAAQAAAILTHPVKSLKRLAGVEVHDTVTLDDYFSWDDEWEEEHVDDESEEDTTMTVPSPWKRQFLERLEACPSVTSLRLTHKGDIKQLEVLARVAPQLTMLAIGVNTDAPSEVNEWCALYARFPSLHTITARHLVMLGAPYLQHNIQKNNECIQMLASACPRLKVLDDVYQKAIIIRGIGEDKEGKNVRWVVRGANKSEEAKIEDGETVYGS